MVRQAKTGGAGSRLGRTETVSIRLDPRLNYLCELAARSQRRTKSSFIEAAIADRIDSLPISNWRDRSEPDTIGERADYLWHVRESQRIVSLGFVAPHLMTYEEQQIWSLIKENGYFWRNGSYSWDIADSEIIRDRVDDLWQTLFDVAHGEKEPSALSRASRATELPENPNLDDELPF